MCRENIKCLHTILESGGISHRDDKQGKQIRGEYENNINRRLFIIRVPCVAGLHITALNEKFFILVIFKFTVSFGNLFILHINQEI